MTRNYAKRFSSTFSLSFFMLLGEEMEIGLKDVEAENVEGNY
jgi:hypothetical protein